MFGTITVNRPELKVRELDVYQQFYCGLCRTLGKQTGLLSHLTLTYDMTFLALLLADLYDEQVQAVPERCPIRPWKHCRKADCPSLSYAADMNVLLSYYNLLDDWYDDKNLRSLTLARTIRAQVRRIRLEYPRQAKAVAQYMKELRQCEKTGSTDLDLAAGLTGEMLGEIFVYREDIWQERLRRLGFFLGKFVYLTDAWEDRAADRAGGSYNPWGEESPEEARKILTLMMSEACRTFEQLPLLEYADILRNIVYSGIWNRFEKANKESEDPSRDGSVQGTGRQIRCHGR